MTANEISDSPEQCPSFTVEKGQGDANYHPDPFYFLPPAISGKTRFDLKKHLLSEVLYNKRP
jgi:hypothetical protein